MSRPTRLRHCDYLGPNRYFVTCCTRDRTVVFASADIVDPLASILLRTADEHSFAILAYCFMPDHLHIVCTGLTPGAAFVPFMKVFRQRTAVSHARRTGDGSPWQPGFHDRVLRESEDTLTVVLYVLNNPVRAGLCLRPEDYRFSYWQGWSD